MRLSKLLVISVALLALAGCSKSSNVTGPGPTGQMQVVVTDAPAAYDAVNLVVTEVSANRGAGDTGWDVLSTSTTTVDLLSLQNGVFTTIGDATVPAGTYQQVRLMLGTGSNVVVDGVSHPLLIPSGMQTGVKLNGPFTLPDNGTLTLQMDFDAAKSITQNGNGDYVMNPVIRLIPSTAAGAIAGIVAPAGVPTSVKVSQNGTEICTNWVNGDGSFKVSVLPAGTYDVLVMDQYGDALIHNGVVVNGGQTTSLGSLSFVFPEPTGSPGGGGQGGTE